MQDILTASTNPKQCLFQTNIYIYTYIYIFIFIMRMSSHNSKFQLIHQLKSIQIYIGMNYNSNQLQQHPQHNHNHNQHLNIISNGSAVVPQATSQFSIPIKIYDGLFMADQYIAQDTQFFETNLITHVINCAGQQIHNNNKIAGVAFLTFDWSENVIQKITEQKVISVTVNFMEECRKQCGCLLINYAASQNRPFCLLACYFMVRFKWSLFKTLQFLNSRKEDVELQPPFFQQLTQFAQKLQERGLIRSKTWVISPSMSDEEIVITNTYLNSKNKFGPAPPQVGNINRNKNKNTVSWKKQLTIEHTYCPNSAISTQKIEKVQKVKEIVDRNQKIDKQSMRKSLIEPSKSQKSDRNPQNSREKREDSLKKSQKQSSQTVLQPQKQNIQPNTSQPSIQKQRTSASSSLTEMNVTRKWAELREMWLRQKQNHNAGNSVTSKGKIYCYSEVSQKQQTPIIVKKEQQKINERLQQKLSILKRHEQKLQPDGRQPKKQHSDILNLQRNLPGHSLEPPSSNSSASYLPSSSLSSSHHNSHNNHHIPSSTSASASGTTSANNSQPMSAMPSTEYSHSRIVHNNWIIDNHQLANDSAHRGSKSKISSGNVHAGYAGGTGNKSVIIVKPNHGSSSLDVKDNQAKCMKDSGLFNAGERPSTANNNQNGQASRSSLRKVAGSDRKQQNNSSLNKQNSNGAKFFRNQATEIISTKGRCSSAKPQRKQAAGSVALGLGLTKNGSLKGKGKWKF